VEIRIKKSLILVSRLIVLLSILTFVPACRSVAKTSGKAVVKGAKMSAKATLEGAKSMGKAVKGAAGVAVGK